MDAVIISDKSYRGDLLQLEMPAHFLIAAINAVTENTVYHHFAEFFHKDTGKMIDLRNDYRTVGIAFNEETKRWSVLMDASDVKDGPQKGVCALSVFAGTPIADKG